MKPREYPLMLDCVERGVSYGIHRARKHTADPTDEQTTQAIVEAVMAAISESWDFDDDADRGR